jgi:D-alanyl-lipoteichoic acid acyltransferase DltB (MBOAT superfamily)
MLFNSANFALFLPVVFLCYWFVVNKNLKAQNILLLLASYFFYACWDWRFVFLLAFSTVLDFYSGIKIFELKKQRQRKFWLIISVGINLGFLGVFKYYNFFAESFADLLANFGLKVHYSTLNIILPVGISFYTFHGLSYVFDIYYQRIKPTYNFVDYTLFVCFFPLLVAGPIERATHLLPQVEKPRSFDYTKAVDGMRQILWGLFKKIVIADTCAAHANLIFDHADMYGGSTLFIGALMFTFQIYGDFSGYSDIALGTARLFGFELLRNFAFPYFSRDIAEFWRRWHISLSSWFRDYLYFPLGGSKGGTWMKVRNTFAIFLVSGFWHGANWTFIFWGALNAVYFLPLLLSNSNRNNLEIVAKGHLLPSFKEVIFMLITFLMTVFAWIFFRAASLNDAFHFVGKLFSSSLFEKPDFIPRVALLLIAFFMIIEWMGRENQFALAKFGFTCPRVLRWSFYFLLVTCIFVFNGKEQQFIYFQF